MHFNLFVFIVFLCSTYFYGNYFLIDCDIPSSSPPPPSPLCGIFVRICTIFTPKMYPSNEQNRDSILFILDLSCYDAFQILFLTFGVIYLLWLFLLYLTTHVTYVNFNTNLNLYNKKTTCIVSIKSISTHLSFIALGLLSCECEKEQLILLIIWFYPNCCKNLLNLLLKKKNLLVGFLLLLFYSIIFLYQSHLLLAFCVFLFFNFGAIHILNVYLIGYQFF